MQVTLNVAKDMVTQIIREGLVPMVAGSPAVGKSSIIHQIAQEYNLKVIDMRLSQCDPTDLLGLPMLTTGRADFAPPLTFPIEGDPIPEGYSGWILFLDEFSSAPRGVQAAA